MRKILRSMVRRFYREKIIFRTPEPKKSTFPPVFVFGVHRSGTTLMRLVLDSHSRIACPLESMFISPLSKLWEDELALKGLAGMGFQETHVKEKFKEFIDYFFDTYAQSRGKVRWVDKCPHYVDNMNFIESLYGSEARYIFLFRHGLDVACSVANMPIEPAEKHKIDCGDPYVGGARYWAKQCEKILDFEEEVGGRGVRVYYEELVNNPEKALRPVFQHIGEEWEEQVLRFYDFDHCRTPGLEDPKASHSKAFYKSLENWTELEVSTVKRMKKEVSPVLKRLGYSSDHAFLQR